MIQTAGIPARALTAETDLATRREAINLLQRGELNALFTVDLFNEGVDLPTVDTILLLMTELVTNVLVHTDGAPAVRVSLLADHVHVEVLDPDPTPVRAAQPDPHALSGRGLHLVDSLASGWGSVGVGTGKVVWFDVARQA